MSKRRKYAAAFVGIVCSMCPQAWALYYDVQVHVNGDVAGGHPGRVTITISGSSPQAGTSTYLAYDPGTRSDGQTYFAQNFPFFEVSRQYGGQCDYIVNECCSGGLLYATWSISGAADDGSWTIATTVTAVGGWGHEDICGVVPCSFPGCRITAELTAIVAPDGDHTKPCEESTVCATCSANQPMAQYSIQLLLASLHITDTPIKYNSPRGPSTDFTVVYNQREANQPSSFPFSNFGAKWTFNWLSYVTDDPNNSSGDVSVYARGGGTERYVGFNAGTYAAEKQTLAVLVRTASGYEKRFPDGSKEVFTQGDGSSSYPRRVFLTSVVDPQNNATTITYDSNFRISSITDSLNQSTTLSYASSGDTLKVIKVTDPFGRFATFDYTNGQLTRITDPVGIKSEFEYEAGTDFIKTMTTPYGISKFSRGETGNDYRWLQAEDPLGGQERVEYHKIAPTVASAETAAPSGVNNANLHLKNTFYWDKKAMEEAPGNYSKARAFHWLSAAHGKISGIKASEKKALEGRVWYNYGDQSANPEIVGANARATKIARVLDDPDPQVTQNQYNNLGNITVSVDPIGRVTSYVYYANDIDLHFVYQRNPAGADTDPYDPSQRADKIAGYVYDDPTAPPHLPHKYTDAAGQTTTYTYEADGQIQTVTNAKGEMTTYGYGNGSNGQPVGYLTSITSPAFNGSSAVRSFVYDNAKRVICIIDDPDHYIISAYYDALDRPTEILHPDGSFQQLQYTDNNTGKMTLDLTRRRDRRGRWTYREYDGNRHLTKVREHVTDGPPAQDRVTQYAWCTCGSLTGITDPNQHATAFNRDLQSRVTSKVFADSSGISYIYENTTSRLKSMTDAKDQVTNYSYFADDNPKQITYRTSYGQPISSTPDVTFTYEQYYNRLATMTDGTGATTYQYYPVTSPSTLGAGQLHTVDGPLDNDTITYGYDKLGRTTNQNIDGPYNDVTVTYDSLGRVSQTRNGLGFLTPNYDGVTPRVLQLTAQNNESPALVTNYTYFDNSHDRRLQTLENLGGGFLNLSKFDYTDDAEGQIQSWTKQLGTTIPSATGNYSYDLVDQLTKATTATLTPPANFVYTYDLAGNRKTDQQGTAIHSFNEVNEITDPGFTYDGNGNLTADGLNTYTWDAANRLTAIQKTVTVLAETTITTGPPPPTPTPTPIPTIPPIQANPPPTPTPIPTPVTVTTRSEFSYDGLGRRVRIVEKQVTGNQTIDASTPALSDHRYVWSGNTLVQERDGAGINVTKKFFAQGEVIGNTGYYYARDHLGSIRELVDFTGGLHAEYEYDPYGVRTKLSGDVDADFGFTGYWHHIPSGLNLALYRAYSPTLGRWISRDPIGEEGGLNLYEYVHNNPANLIDILGLREWFATSFAAAQAGARDDLRHAFGGDVEWGGFVCKTKCDKDGKPFYYTEPKAGHSGKPPRGSDTANTYSMPNEYNKCDDGDDTVALHYGTPHGAVMPDWDKGDSQRNKQPFMLATPEGGGSSPHLIPYPRDPKLWPK